MHETHITALSNGVPVGAVRQVDYLQLNQGERVYYPEDLLAVISRDSPSGRAAERSRDARSTANTLAGLGYGGIAIGGGLMLSPVLSSSGGDFNMTPVYIGGGTMMLGLILGLVASSYRGTANDEAATAFETYDSALRDSLQYTESNSVPH
jgi:hypothetical protein